MQTERTVPICIVLRRLSRQYRFHLFIFSPVNIPILHSIPLERLFAQNTILGKVNNGHSRNALFHYDSSSLDTTRAHGLLGRALFLRHKHWSHI